MDAPPVRYARTSDGYDIAYCTIGNGPNFVLMPEPFNHLHLMWGNPVYRSLYEPLSERFRLIQFDPRGWGLSTRGLKPGHTARSHMEDLDAVIGALSVTKTVLYGGYYFGTVAAEYAARHPQRVRGLILWNIDVGGPIAQDAILNELSANSWNLFLETMARTFYSYEDTGQAMERLKAAVHHSDFRPQEHRDWGDWDIPMTLRSLTVPTLVVARRGDMLGMEEKGKQIAGLVPDARLVFFDDIAGGRYASDGTMPALVTAIDDFLTSIPVAEEPYLLSSALSSRESEVLRLLAAGRSNQQIADDLVISLNTVRRHVSNIFDKTGAANRAQAAIYARDHGLA